MRIVGSGAQLLARAWQEGADVCARQARKLQPVPGTKQDPELVDRTAYAQVTFKCVASEAAR